MKPCDWCDRETQETCPECKGTGFVTKYSDEPEDYTEYDDTGDTIVTPSNNKADEEKE